MKKNQKKPNSIDQQILNAITALGHGAIFVPTDFLTLGSRQTVDIVLHRLVRKGTIRRLARGVYDFPKEHPKLGKLQPEGLDNLGQATVIDLVHQVLLFHPR